MKKTIIAFDIDGTLRDNRSDSKLLINERVRGILVAFARFKNVEIVVWSGGGELYARHIGHEMGLDSYVNKYMAKTEGYADIAIDDIQDCSLGIINLIVREK